MNTDVIENNQNYPTYPNPYMPSYPGYGMPQDPYEHRNGFDYPNNHMGMNPYMPYDNNYNGKDIVAEVYLQLVILIILSSTPFIIYGIKRLLKKVGILSPIVIRFLDVFQIIITKTFSRIAKLIIEKKTKTKLKGKNETIEAVEQHITEGLKDQLHVEPNQAHTDDAIRYDSSAYRSTNTDDIERSK